MPKEKKYSQKIRDIQKVMSKITVKIPRFRYERSLKGLYNHE